MINQYRETLESNIFSAMELAKQSYPDTLKMPVNRFQTYLKWKIKLEEDKSKSLDEQLAKGR